MFQGAAGFVFLWCLLRRKIPESQSGVTSYGVLARGNKRCALHSPPHFNWPTGLIFSTFFLFSLPLLIWRYGIYRALCLILAPFVVAVGVPQVLNEFIFKDSSVGGVSLSLWLLLAMRSLIGLSVAWNDSKYCQHSLVQRGWKNVGLFQAASKKLAIRDSRLSQP